MDFRVLILFFSFRFHFQCIGTHVIDFLSVCGFCAEAGRDGGFAVQFAKYHFQGGCIFLMDESIISVCLVISNVLQIAYTFVEPEFGKFLCFVSQTGDKFQVY